MGGVRDLEKKERKNKSLDGLFCHIWNFIAELGWVKKNLFFCSLSRSFTYKATSDANACPSSDAVSICIQTWNSKKQVLVGVKPCRGNVCAPGHLNTETISLQNSGVSSWRLFLAALEIILYLELLGTQSILKANRKAKTLPQGSYNWSWSKAEWKCWLHGLKNHKVGTFIWKAKCSTKLFSFSCVHAWLLESFLALA